MIGSSVFSRGIIFRPPVSVEPTEVVESVSTEDMTRVGSPAASEPAKSRLMSVAWNFFSQILGRGSRCTGFATKAIVRKLSDENARNNAIILCCLLQVCYHYVSRYMQEEGDGSEPLSLLPNLSAFAPAVLPLLQTMKGGAIIPKNSSKPFLKYLAKAENVLQVSSMAYYALSLMSYCQVANHISNTSALLGTPVWALSLPVTVPLRIATFSPIAKLVTASLIGVRQTGEGRRITNGLASAAANAGGEVVNLAARYVTNKVVERFNRFYTGVKEDLEKVQTLVDAHTVSIIFKRSNFLSNSLSAGAMRFGMGLMQTALAVSALVLYAANNSAKRIYAVYTKTPYSTSEVEAELWVEAKKMGGKGVTNTFRGAFETVTSPIGYVLNKITRLVNKEGFFHAMDANEKKVQTEGLEAAKRVCNKFSWIPCPVLPVIPGLMRFAATIYEAMNAPKSSSWKSLAFNMFRSLGEISLGIAPIVFIELHMIKLLIVHLCILIYDGYNHWNSPGQVEAASQVEEEEVAASIGPPSREKSIWNALIRKVEKDFGASSRDSDAPSPRVSEWGMLRAGAHLS